ncbi:hypothetical protein AMS68_000437 [Peltaster fructicola]|uniref:non-specific serine/threonine protein kinase n=1 Tax=Peltaster fructicola TaxID=286661 RepID=A0A6H0XK76_9PEZI|nr:hypothetical protein AMS68_000437 [Peltaster fructicola]
MARTNAITNGNYASGDALPPSTLAAQIVQNQVRPTVNKQSEQQALFNNLLSELLLNPSADVETNVETNVQLVKVLVEAGLSVLTHEQPFAHDILVQQAKDSIAVIEHTFNRQPEILAAPIHDSGPPVCVWLLARVSAIAGRRAADKIPLFHLLDVATRALSRPTKLWKFAVAFKNLLRDTADDILSTIEALTTLSDISLRVPPARSLSVLWPQSDGAIAASTDCQAHIRDGPHACLLVLQLSTLSHIQAVRQGDNVIRMKLAALRFMKASKDKKPWVNILCSILVCANHDVQASTVDDILNYFDSSETVPAQLQHAIARALEDVLMTNDWSICQPFLASARQMQNSTRYPNLDEDLERAVVVLLDLATAQESLDTTNRKRRKVAQVPDTIQAKRTALEFFNVRESDDRAMARHLCEAFSSLDHSRLHTAWQHLAQLARSAPGVAVRALSDLLDDTTSEPKLRVLSLRVVQICIPTVPDLDISTSPLDRAVLRGLRSSSRDVRIAAGNCVPAILQQQMPASERSRHVLLQWMRQLADQNVLAIQETLIPIWGHVAAACNVDELNLVLLRLVEYFGHPNSLIRGLAFTELQNVASTRAGAGSVETLFAPYWSTIGVSVVQDLFSCPQKVQMLCDLLVKDVNTFLTMTQVHTTPHLVATKRKDILLRVAAARGPGASVRDVCLHPRTSLIAVMSHLLCQHGNESENFAITCLAAVDSSFRGEDLGDYVKIDSTAIACEVLKFAGEQSKENKAKAYGSFMVLADLCERAPGHRRPQSKVSPVTAFLRRHILGILTGFSSVIEAGQDAQTVRNKIACLQATAEMITLAQEDISSALPQLRALLQSAIELPGLCEASWSTWLTLLPILNDDDIELVIEQVFVLILRHWHAMSDDLQVRTHKVIADLVKQASVVITAHVLRLPSLSCISLFSKIGAQIDQLVAQEPVEGYYKAASLRLKGENPLVITQALKDLVKYLEAHQDVIHDTATSEQPSESLSDLTRSLLDVALNVNRSDQEAAQLCGKALGLIGCLDPNRIEAARQKEHLLVLSNFDKADETVRWVIVLLEEYLVKAFRSVTNAQAQGFMAYVIQELLKFCGFDTDVALQTRATQTGRESQRWQEMPEHVRTTLTPFMSSKYTVTTSASYNPPQRVYPGFSAESSHSSWLRGLVYDLTWKAKGENGKILFPHLARIVRNHALVIANFLLPYIALNIILGGTVQEVDDIRQEVLAVLSWPVDNSAHFETVKLCSESLFGTLDYMTVWLQEKRKVLTETRANAFRTGMSPGDFDEVKDMGQIETVEKFLSTIPADLVAKRAMDCGAYSRALFNWEQFIRETRPIVPPANTSLDDDDGDYYRLHDIYAQIDEPDGLEGISAHLTILTEEQQATLHARSGRWTAAQAWYESKLINDRGNEELQGSLLHCLQETGRYSTLMRYAQSFRTSTSNPKYLDSYRVEAAWMTNDIVALKTALQDVSSTDNTFSIGIGRLLLASVQGQQEECKELLTSLRCAVTLGMTSVSTSSIQASHEDLKRLHLLAEVELINSTANAVTVPFDLIKILDKRLDVLGTYNADKQSVLAVRRFLLGAKGSTQGARYTARSWLKAATFARKQGNIESAYHAVLQAAELGAKASRLEEAKLLWHEGHRRQAIYAIDQAINAGIFADEEDSQSTGGTAATVITQGVKQNLMAARAYLLQSKWLDSAGQTQSKEMTHKYQHAAKTMQKWEKGHYYLGKHYQRLLEGEKALPKAKQNQVYVNGELTKLVIENLLRSLPFGNKYWYESIPKLLTLWLDLGMEVFDKHPREDKAITEHRIKSLMGTHKQLRKYIDRSAPYICYSALPQMLSRVSHPHPDVWRELSHIIIRIASTYPAQTLWSVLSLMKATDKTRLERGKELIGRLSDSKLNVNVDVRQLIISGQRLSNALLAASEAPVDARATSASLSRDLHFRMNLAPCGLVVPIEMTLMVNLPPTADSQRIRSHKPFMQEKVTIQSFQDNVLVLSSLQRPKKLTLRGSDGKLYGLLCKPKDDLRKDQRLMEFNSTINRALKRDAAGSTRRLYIKTYAVTPLSEESGCLEWVEGIKPIRDILLNLYTRKGTRPNYTEIRNDLNEACKAPQNVHIFEDKVQSKFPPALHEWFTEVFPEPDTWFASRLRYARSAAVMSMTGHVLGLGDRHGENILLQESTGGVFHVDFNCLFDKGLTFEKPEVVPFRLTRNMTDAMGPYGHEGPFRRSCEVTLGLLRQHKDTLMTILETFIHDPTTDFVAKKKRNIPGVPETPQEILDSIDGKLKGLFRGETMPLSVEGYVDALINQAVDSWNLCQMYIGWCAFL